MNRHRERGDDLVGPNPFGFGPPCQESWSFPSLETRRFTTLIELSQGA
jgi:hypothetical protein